MVEARRVELLSESPSTRTSPSADDRLNSLSQTWVVTLKRSVESSCVARSTLSVLTGTTISRPSPARGPSGADGRVMQRREQFCCCSLIYKLPILRVLGALARYSCFFAPVETGTPPYCPAESGVKRVLSSCKIDHQALGENF